MDAALKATALNSARGMARKYTPPKNAPRENDAFEKEMVPDEMNADLMSADEIHRSLEEGYQDAIAGRVHDATEVFANLGEHMRQ